MCSILGIFDLAAGDDLAALRRRALALSTRQRHRGPDWSGVHADAGAILVHERLGIVDPVVARSRWCRVMAIWCWRSMVKSTTTRSCARG